MFRPDSEDVAEWSDEACLEQVQEDDVDDDDDDDDGDAEEEQDKSLDAKHMKNIFDSLVRTAASTKDRSGEGWGNIRLCLCEHLVGYNVVAGISDTPTS